MHGKCVYDYNNQQHVDKVWTWLKKSKQPSKNKRIKKVYDYAIRTWTFTDPLKRQIAKENNLNWIEFFTMEQFMDWFNNL